MATVSTTAFLKTMLKHTDTEGTQILLITYSRTVDALRAKHGYFDPSAQESFDTAQKRLELAAVLQGYRSGVYEELDAAQQEDTIRLALAPTNQLLQAATDALKGCGWSVEYDGRHWQGGPPAWDK
jgi:hypothetical protein